MIVRNNILELTLLPPANEFAVVFVCSQRGHHVIGHMGPALALASLRHVPPMTYLNLFTM